CDTRLALALVARLCSPAEAGPAITWDDLPITDLDTLLLRLRQVVLGDHVRADAVCDAAGCRARLDLGFRISDYLGHHRPRVPRGVEPCAEAGWFSLGGGCPSFRLPTGADMVAIAHERDPKRALERRCVRETSAPSPPGALRRIEGAMEAMAP